MHLQIVTHKVKSAMGLAGVGSNRLNWIIFLFGEFFHTAEVNSICNAKSDVAYAEILCFCRNKDFDDLFAFLSFVSVKSAIGFFEVVLYLSKLHLLSNWLVGALRDPKQLHQIRLNQPGLFLHLFVPSPI